MPDGFLNINKPTSMTSHDVVSKVRRAFRIKAVGHMGTLDPEATGVLPLAVGKATRLIPFVEGDTKRYVGEVVVGMGTDTLDVHGKVIESADASEINADNIVSLLPAFTGVQSQIPPMYSAIKIEGKKLYEYARKGETVELEPREIFFHAIQLVGFRREGPLFIATLDISCSKGTYVRSLCRDIGAHLGLPACMGKLHRTASGPFKLEQSVSLSEFISEPSLYLIPITDFLSTRPNIKVDYQTALRFLRGQRIAGQGELCGTYAVLYRDVFLGLGNVLYGVLAPKKVLAQEGDICDSH